MLFCVKLWIESWGRVSVSSLSSELHLGLRLEELLLLEIPLHLLSVQVIEVIGKDQKSFLGDSLESQEPTHPVGI